jgi:hypothetical protein
VICKQPVGMLGAARKQWLKLSRALQKQRASTLNADKILKHTHSITHMQHMQFSAKGPLDSPETDVYFLRPDEILVLPVHCLTVYVLDSMNWTTAQKMLGQLPADALIVDYENTLPWEEGFGLQPKSVLELGVENEWRQIGLFLQTYNIDIDSLDSSDTQAVDSMDTALDQLLEVSDKFLRVAQSFQQALALARPLNLSKQQRAQYDALILLAHRVQALTSGVFTQRFLESYNEDDTFFLYGVERDLLHGDIRQQITGHLAAGRTRLAAALREIAETRLLTIEARGVAKRSPNDVGVGLSRNLLRH